MMIYKGIFWGNPAEEKLIVKKSACDHNESPLKEAEYLKVCNMCGKTFDFWDNQENFCFDRHIGYGSKYDLERIQLKLCCDCFDKVLDWLLPRCKHDPMSEYR